MFGKIIKENRMNAGIGLREFAARIGISPGYLSDLENEKVAPPSEKLILEMAKTLGIEKNKLLKAAEKVDPEVSEYVAREPRASDFLRMAKEQGYENGDWERLAQLARIAKLGKGEEGKK